MDPPRSRRPSSPSLGGSTTKSRGDLQSSALIPFLSQTVADTHVETMRFDTSDSVDKKSGRAVQVTRVFFVAIAGMLLFTLMLSLKAHFSQSAVAQSSNMIMPTSGTIDRINLMKSNQTSDRLQHQLGFRAMPKFDVEPDHHDSTTWQAGLKDTYTDSWTEGLLVDFTKFESPDKCASRGHRSSTEYIPTLYLIQRLRHYESRHRKCARFAESFVNDILELKDSSEGSRSGDCRFVVWIAYSGLGNRLLSLVSAFLYAILTNRILLVDRGTDMSELFCEPFPGTSWLLPPEFPHIWLAGLNESSDHRFGRQFKTNVRSPGFSYVHLTHTYKLDDRMFFCDQAQDYLYHIPWLFMRANNYIVPGLYFLSSVRPQLDKLFSHKETVFHLLGRYLFHPSNIAWAWISRFRKAYLAKNGKQVGIQIRTFSDTHQSYFQEQLSRCALDNNVLPGLMTMELDYIGKKSDTEGSDKVISILVTSLQPEYYEKIRDLYMSAPTRDGQYVAVHQPTREGWQKAHTFRHDLKAWADIYLLSFSDVLITSGWSTFGYSAQALAGVKPWILYRSFNYTVPNPPCTYARSIEPCFHTPPLMDCQKTGVPRNPATLVPFIQTCEDIPWGIKLVQDY